MGKSVLLVCVAALVTLLLRALPFLIFGGKRQMPGFLQKVSNLLPPAIMGVLVIYCIKADIIALQASMQLKSVIPTITALFTVVGVHLWKRKTIFSIFIGTLVYMILIRL